MSRSTRIVFYGAIAAWLIAFAIFLKYLGDPVDITLVAFLFVSAAATYTTYAYTINRAIDRDKERDRA